MKTATRLVSVLVLLALVFGPSGFTPAYASTIIVTNNADSGPGSLRDAIANASSGDTITFDNDYTITLASQLDIINKTITITGEGRQITISGNNAVRVFHVGSTGGSGNLTLDHLNIVNGKSAVEECAGSAVACGGGLMLEYLTTATVLNSTFSNNDGGMAGGAIYSYYGNPLTVTNSVFINNHAVAYAGAIETFYGTATLTNNTFWGNTSGAYGSAILNTWGTMTLKNNIFIKGGSVNTCDSDFSDGGITNDGGGNIRFGDNTCPGTTADPLLGTLGDYGGGVMTTPLLPGSPAINAASANCPATDARGVTRGTTCDSGAFESQGFTLVKVSGDNQSTAHDTAFPNSLALNVTSAFGEPVDGGIVKLTAPAIGASLATTSYNLTIAGGAVEQNVTANSVIGGPYNVTASATGASSLNFSLTNISKSPTNIVLSASSVNENLPIGTEVGAFTATDPDVGDTHTYSFCGGINDASFAIVGSSLNTAAVFDYETKNSYAICVQADDGQGGTLDKNFTITVTDVNENQPPTNISLSNNSVNENQPASTLVGSLSTTDPDAGDTFTYSFCGGADDGSFQISGSQLQTHTAFDYETKNSYAICIRTNDGHGGTFDKTFTIAVNNVIESGSVILRSTGVQDGWILESTETSNEGGTMKADTTTLRLGDDMAKKQYRSVLSFATGAAIPDNATITKVTLKVKRHAVLGGGNPVTIFQGFMADIRKGIFGTTSALQPTDWQATPSKIYGPFNTAIVSGWYSIDLSAGKAYINKLASLSGLTQIRLRFQLGDNNNAIANYISLYSGDAAIANRPQLIIEYNLP
ncbi:MAG: cadherin domain-containing protein [Chloroflexi bacterium]|nr:cadherin domain-containing protein [Chloroflexota bacterium]